MALEIGSQVHFVAPSGAHRPAQVVAVVSAEGAPAEVADLMVTYHPEDRVGTAFAYALWAAHDEDTKAPGTWHWPEVAA